jgi:hypothetical protein
MYTDDNNIKYTELYNMVNEITIIKQKLISSIHIESNDILKEIGDKYLDLLAYYNIISYDVFDVMASIINDDIYDI